MTEDAPQHPTGEPTKAEVDGWAARLTSALASGGVDVLEALISELIARFPGGHSLIDWMIDQAREAIDRIRRQETDS